MLWLHLNFCSCKNVHTLFYPFHTYESSCGISSLKKVIKLTRVCEVFATIALPWCYIHAKICDDESARVAFYLIYCTVIFVFAHQFVHFLLPSKSLVIGDSKSRQTPEEITWQACRSYINTGHWSCELVYNQTPCSRISSWKGTTVRLLSSVNLLCEPPK